MPAPPYNDWLNQLQRLLATSDAPDAFPADAFFGFAKQGLAWLNDGKNPVDSAQIASWWPELIGRKPGEQAEKTPLTECWKEWSACEQAVQIRYGQALQSALEDLAIRLENLPIPLPDIQAFYGLWIECSEFAYAKLREDENFLRQNAKRCNASIRLIAESKKIFQPDTDEISALRKELVAMRAKVKALESRT